MRSKVTVIWRFLATLAVFFGVGGWLGGGSALAGSFHQAAFQGRLEMVKKQIASKKNEINESDGYGSTPLHHAAMGGQMEMTTWLIKNGAVVDSHNSGGATSLLLAVRSGKMEVAKALVEAGADVHV
ncbi:MAG TPA: ankyrin repeat domain-containing protein, partial [Magnetococcales bacterium]|nr:ankyrin repeat domain-containing protein [Magnetococcales bacterium]